jgi:hypothetical protein
MMAASAIYFDSSLIANKRCDAHICGEVPTRAGEELGWASTLVDRLGVRELGGWWYLVSDGGIDFLQRFAVQVERDGLEGGRQRGSVFDRSRLAIPVAAAPSLSGDLTMDVVLLGSRRRRRYQTAATRFHALLARLSQSACCSDYC